MDYCVITYLGVPFVIYHLHFFPSTKIRLQNWVVIYGSPFGPQIEQEPGLTRLRLLHMDSNHGRLGFFWEGTVRFLQKIERNEDCNDQRRISFYCDKLNEYVNQLVKILE